MVVYGDLRSDATPRLWQSPGIASFVTIGIDFSLRVGSRTSDLSRAPQDRYSMLLTVMFSRIISLIVRWTHFRTRNNVEIRAKRRRVRHAAGLCSPGRKGPLEGLQSNYEERVPRGTLLNVDPVFDALHSDQRFRDLVHRIPRAIKADDFGSALTVRR